MKILNFILITIFLKQPLQAQNIKVYFNQSVDNTASTITNAQMSLHLEDTICALIDLANLTLDIAVWDNGSSKIVTAINNAYNRGVQVRYISSTNSLNSALAALNANIPVLKRNSGLTSNVMHNKFVIVDNLHLLTGSMNFGMGSMEDDYNNIVIIQYANLAQNYTTEFNEMWGATTALPNTSNSKFGPAKSDNTIHNFNIGTIPVQSYFSPTDNTTAQIVNAINTADYSLDIAIFTFINNDIGDAVVAAKNRGVNVRCIIENVSYFGSEYNSLLNAGVNVLSHQNTAYDFHHKYCIIDAVNAASDPMVVTGSHNYTNSAEDEYDENTLVIHSHVIAQQYLEEFTKRFTELGGVGIQEIANDNHFNIYPNPTSGVFYIDFEKHLTNLSIEIFNLLGEKIYTLSNTSTPIKIALFDIPKGIYLVKIEAENKVYTQKIVVQ